MSAELARALETMKGDRSLRALARELEVSPATAESWLKGWRTPELRHIPRLADCLGLDWGTLVTWEIDALRGKSWFRGMGLLTHTIEAAA